MSFYLNTPAGMVEQAAQFRRNQALNEALARSRRSKPSPEYLAYRKREDEALAKILGSIRKAA